MPSHSLTLQYQETGSLARRPRDQCVHCRFHRTVRVADDPHQRPPWDEQPQQDGSGLLNSAANLALFLDALTLQDDFSKRS